MEKDTTASRHRKNKPITLNGIRAERFVRVLINEIANVRSVKDWAKETTTPESSLNRIIKHRYHKTPGDILNEVRYEHIIMLMKEDPETGAYCIALESGLRSEAAMRMFLRRCYDTNIRSLRRKILKI